MIVTRSEFEAVVAVLSRAGDRAVDSETTGLRPYRGDRLFSIIISDDENVWYLNFQEYPGLSDECVLPRAWLERLKPVFSNPDSRWDMHNAKYDLHMLAQDGLFVAGPVYCTRTHARLEYNAHMRYTLEDCAARIGEKKDDQVKAYCLENKLWEWEQNPFRKARKKRFFYDRVPLDRIVPYAEQDARVTRRLAQHQRAEFDKIDSLTPQGIPSIFQPGVLERDITKIAFQMERVGLKIDRTYCERGYAHEKERQKEIQENFQEITGREGINSRKVFSEIFRDENLVLTDKGNPSFTSKVLKTFKSPVARVVLDYRDAMSRANFYSGFLYHADGDDVVHPNLNQDGTKTGRFSSSDPNFQNLTKEDVDDEEEDEGLLGETDPEEQFFIRRAIVPRAGYFLASLDYDQMEYRLMLDYAGAKELITKVRGGLDVHEATAQVARITRDQAKTTNFAVLYGSGIATLAANLGCTEAQARRIRSSIFESAPEIQTLIRKVSLTAERRGYIVNWYGGRYWFPDARFSYKAPNYLIQGGCAYIVKVAMRDVAKLLEGKKSRMILQVHDELLLEIHESENELIPLIKAVMEKAYPYKHLPLTVGVKTSFDSWADVKKYAA